jgi:TolB-like protein/Flp pilus assembly protein TadD
VSGESKAVFLSYASEDAEAAQRICDALRAAGVEVWLDKSDLRGGDSWDRSIRQQIHDCALFVPIISQHTHERLEGYFRREWKLAVDRTHDMAEIKAFLVPVVIDSTTEQDPATPEKFRELQWTRLPEGETPPAFVERVRRLLAPADPHVPTPGHAQTGPVSAATRQSSASWSKRALPLAAAVLVLIAVAYLAIDRPWISKQPAASPTPASAASTAFTPPPHSIAVLPFVNMSGDKEQEYFSDGLTEELLNSLARTNELQVAARTSSFSFQGEHPDISTVAHKLNVGAVLEGSVRRSAHTIRVTTQLINGVTGFHLWSQTYDRDLGDVLALQTEIANAVANALRVTLLGDVAARVEVGGTRNPAAFDAYLKGAQAFRGYHDANDLKIAIAAYADAIQLDPNYALAFVGRSRASDELASYYVPGVAASAEVYGKALADAHKAIALAPDLGEAHLVLANSLAEHLEFTHASQEYERALRFASGNALVLQDYGLFTVLMGQTDQGLSAARRAVHLDPLNDNALLALFLALTAARQPREAIAVFHDAQTLEPTTWFAQWTPYYMLGDYQGARAICESNSRYPDTHVCLAMTYDKLGRHADAEAELARFKAANPAADDWYQYAEIYAQWGDTTKALSSLEAAVRIRDGSLENLKMDAYLDPLRKEPRFQAIERELKFPN